VKPLYVFISWHVDTEATFPRFQRDIQSVRGGKVNILGGHNISHSKQKKCIYTFVRFRIVSEIELRVFHCTDEQHAMFSRESQSALMLAGEFSKKYYTR
jgi:hypothetical protein